MDFNYNYSIIIPHKDTPELLDRLLNTIPDREDTQVIVCDDCSSQENYKAVKDLKNKYPQIETYQTDSCGGGGKARNLGLRYAKGKYLIFADADDYFNLCFPSMLDKFADTNLDVVYFAANSVDTNTFRNCFRISSNFYKDLDRFLESKNPLDIKFRFSVPWSKFISRDLVERCKIQFEESNIANDVRFSSEVDFNAQSLTATAYAIYCWTDRKGSTSFELNPERLLTRMEINARKIKYVRTNYDVTLYEPSKIIDDYIHLQSCGFNYKSGRMIKVLQEAGITKSMIRRKEFSNWFNRVLSTLRSNIHR